MQDATGREILAEAFARCVRQMMSVLIKIVIPVATGVIAGVVVLKFWPRSGKWGINTSRVACPNCGHPLPSVAFRIPKNKRQALWGGWTCPGCRWDLDKYGQPVHGPDLCKVCGYDLQSCGGEHCPECGSKVIGKSSCKGEVTPSTSTYESVLREITSITGVSFQPSNSDQLSVLDQFALPKSVRVFYEQHAPSTEAEVEFVRILPIESIVEEMTDAMPGIVIRPHGYVIFAVDGGGDAYCFDKECCDNRGEPAIVWIPHDGFDLQTSRVQIEQAARNIAPSLSEFLVQFRDGQLGP